MANIKQIAKMAGVSISTVSRVLNDHPYVREEKRQAVLDAIEQIQYTRNMNAVNLIKGTTGNIAIMLPFINHAYFSQLIEGAANEALKSGFHLMLCQTNYSEVEETKVLEMLKLRQIDGTIIASKSLPLEQIEPYTQYGPIVACENTSDSSVSSVYLDHDRCFRKALQLLTDKGHNRIGFCVGRSDGNSTVIRRRAYMEHMELIRQPVQEQWMFHDCYTIEDGAGVFHKLTAMSERPTAMLVTGDQAAAGLLMEARSAGVRVPEELAIIGFDNQPIAKVMQLTTIDNHLFEMGTTAFSMLHDRIAVVNKEPEHRALAFEIIERDTV
ncbi:LacI family transcriptional regulator [Paenibacillus taihuensis]|uniref:LacI family transcriptional regulator n=1 Tax=Paenibacillus taihuensis TaxID=1156355 RepID=A0A3D9S3S3_9BACL|nr:LacI family DNA-binding transcriptional regulator [Paenibacillus taihuensis]REE87435.1 LacI family transcriptional regulator [Paenibacillus taihuensis]